MNKKNSYYKIITSIKKYKNILIYIKGSPDPDVIASSFALKLICRKFSVLSTIYADTILSLQENRRFVKMLNIPITFDKNKINFGSFDAYAILDHQSAIVEKLTGKLHCAIHIDHHEIIEEEISVDFKLIDLNAGSTCTIIAMLLKDLDLQFNDLELTDISTALLFGIKTDTDNFIHTGEIDHIAIDFLSKYADKIIIEKFDGLAFSKISKEILSLAVKNKYIYKDWLITGIDFIEQKNRDMIPIIADHLLKIENFSTIVVYAAVINEHKLILDVSFRTNNESIDLNSIIKEITDQGGGRKFKGAFQINLDFFFHCPDRNLLLELIKLTVIKVLSERRDKIYVTEIKGLYHRIKHKISKIISRT